MRTERSTLSKGASMPPTPTIATDRPVSDPVLIAWIMGRDSWERENQSLSATCLVQIGEDIWIDAYELEGMHEVLVAQVRVPLDKAVLTQMQNAGDVTQSRIHTGNPGVTWCTTAQYGEKAIPIQDELCARLKDRFNASGHLPLYKAVETALSTGTPLFDALAAEQDKE